MLESDKASMEIPADEGGVIKEILVSSGDSLKTGALLMRLETAASTNETGLEQNKIETNQEGVEERLTENKGIALNERASFWLICFTRS